MITKADGQLYQSVIQAILIIPYSLILYRLHISFALKSDKSTNKRARSIKLCAVYYYLSLSIWCILCATYCILNYFIIKQIFDDNVLKPIYYIIFAVAIAFAYGSFDLFGYFIKIKLEDTYRNTSLQVKSTFINMLFWISVISSIVAAATFILEYCISHWYPRFSSWSFIVLISRGSYLILAEIYLCSVVFIFNRKLFQFTKLTNSNSKQLSVQINNTVKNFITKQTNLMSVMLVGSLMYNIFYIVYYVYFYNENTADAIYETFFFLWQLSTSICIYLTFQFNDNQYKFVCKHCHSFCLNICQRLAGQGINTDDDFDQQLLIGDENNSLQYISISYASLVIHDCGGITKDCQVVENMCVLLNQYNQNQTNIEKYVDEKNISTQMILDEFDHLLSFHDDPDSFHYIHNHLNVCKPALCQDYSRYTRYRTVNEMKEDKDESNTIIHDIVGKIHSFYQHTYDALMRCNPNKITSISGIMNTNISNKFNSSLKVDQNNPENSAHSLYRFGQRFEYVESKDDETKQDWFVCPKYRSFKEELVNNKLARISMHEYNNQHVKCKEYIKSKYTKILKGRCENIKLSPSHILSLLVYCNCDNFQNVWSSTFRRIHHNETDEALKNRHSNFYFSSLNLRQLVEYFGTTLMDDDRRKCFYHGVSEILYFIRTNTQFNTPLSTSTEKIVASNFTNNNGIILELSYSFSTFPLRARYFSCSFFSDYVNEKECLFVGGVPMMMITNIININDDTIYRKYINAINIINSLLNGTYKTNKNNMNNDQCSIDLCCELLLSDNNTKCPKYISTLLNKYCLNLKNIVIYWNDMCSIQQFTDAFCVNNANNMQFFNLNVLLKLFPNIEQIEYFNKSLENTNPLVRRSEFEKIIEYITQFKNANNNLKYVVIYHHEPLKKLQDINQNKWQSHQENDKIILYTNNANIHALDLCFPKRDLGYDSQAILLNIT